jgi:hypothetical protein
MYMQVSASSPTIILIAVGMNHEDEAGHNKATEAEELEDTRI